MTSSRWWMLLPKLTHTWWRLLSIFCRQTGASRNSWTVGFNSMHLSTGCGENRRREWRLPGWKAWRGAPSATWRALSKLTMGDLRGSAVVYGALPGEALLSSANRETAEKLARAILDPAERFSPVVPVCPLCGGDTFRFLPDGRARCMLCSGSGPWEWKNESLRFHIDPGEHPLFLSKDDVNRHAEWLRGMKEKFLERKQELKAVVKEYLGVGTFIENDRL